ncbi:MAG: class I SAM-dependent methyltransferase [Ignavibacteriales bacterium]|jgi:cyclopropane fatty-acyl-phospholipid synthase-like methyltransferase|nr:MAG: class I SAM-dependent methyltransferase [Ignavibacteriales bacterium]
MSKNNVADFYDGFVENQKKIGVNDRIYGLYKRLLKLGLKSNSNVLELGCGIGTNTFLISKKVSSGKIECVDISPESIKFLKEKLNRPNTSYVVHDIVNYSPTLENIDFITLFDVIEHIPIERHSELFENISKIMTPKTKLVINIPNPSYIEYLAEHKPKLLQVIDQPVHLAGIIENISRCGLELKFFETYNLWTLDDYQFMVITKQKKYEEVRLENQLSFWNKFKAKLQRAWFKTVHHYS